MREVTLPPLLPFEEMGGRNTPPVLLNEKTPLQVALLWLCMFVGLSVEGNVHSAVCFVKG